MNSMNQMKKLRREPVLLGESILYPMIHTIKNVANDKHAYEDIIILVDDIEEAENFARHLRDLGVVAVVHSF